LYYRDTAAHPENDLSRRAHQPPHQLLPLEEQVKSGDPGWARFIPLEARE